MPKIRPFDKRKTTDIALVVNKLSERILSKKSGAIVFDVKCSNHLDELIIRNNGVPVMAPTGHFHIKKTIKDNNALLGGEMSGHIFFNDKWDISDLDRLEPRQASVVMP